jgi:hypothetical protein
MPRYPASPRRCQRCSTDRTGHTFNFWRYHSFLWLFCRAVMIIPPYTDTRGNLKIFRLHWRKENPLSPCAFVFLRRLVENTRLARHPAVHGVGFMEDAGMCSLTSVTLSSRTTIFPLLNLTNQFSRIQDTFVSHICDILYAWAQWLRCTR